MKRFDRVTATLTAALFCFLLFGMGLWTALAPDPAYVVSERRKITPMPTRLAQLDSLEDYLLDTLPPREALRRVRNQWLRHFLGFRLIDGHFLTENGVAKDLSASSLSLAEGNAVFFHKLKETYFPDSHRVYYALIPDKGQYAHEGITLDYGLFADTLSAKEGYIPLAHALTLNDYYATDIHWRQEALFPVAAALGNAMGFAPPDPEAYTEKTLGSFTGALSLGAALSHGSDEMTLLIPQSAPTVTYPDGVVAGLYDEGLFSDSLDPYDVFLRGETVGKYGNFHIHVENRENTSGRRLILFRDSFARSLTPLLLHAYSEIILVDLRAPFYRGGSWEEDLWADGSTDILFLVSTHTYATTRFF